MDGDKNENEQVNGIITAIFEKQKKQLKDEEDIETASRFEYGAKEVVKGNETAFLAYIAAIRQNAELKMKHIPGFDPAQDAAADAGQMAALPKTEQSVIVQSEQVKEKAEGLLKKSLGENARTLVGNQAIADALLNQLLGSLSQEYLAVEASNIKAKYTQDLELRREKIAAGLTVELSALKAAATDDARRNATDALKEKMDEKNLPQKEKDFVLKHLLDNASDPKNIPARPDREKPVGPDEAMKRALDQFIKTVKEPANSSMAALPLKQTGQAGRGTA